MTSPTDDRVLAQYATLSDEQQAMVRDMVELACLRNSPWASRRAAGRHSPILNLGRGAPVVLPFPPRMASSGVTGESSARNQARPGR